MTSLRELAQAFDLPGVADAVRQGQRDEAAFLSDQGATLGVDEPHTPTILAKLREQGYAVDDEDDALFELYETLLGAGHPVPDGSSRRCLVRVIAGADAARHARAQTLMARCAEEGMLDWRTSAWAQDVELRANEDPSALFRHTTPLSRPHVLLADAIGWAARAGNLALLKRLGCLLPEEPQARIAALKNATPAIYPCIWGGSEACMDYLLTLADPEQWPQMGDLGGTPLPMVAAAAGQAHLLRNLAARGLDLDALDARGELGIYAKAMQAKHPQIVPVLLELGARVNTGKAGQASALHMAVWQGYDEVIPPLLAAGADIHRQDMSGKTPLGVAGMVGNDKAARLLMQAAAALEAVDEQGRTAMHWACTNDRLDTFEVLYAEGASLDLPDHDHQTPRSLAKPQVRARIEQLELEQSTPTASARRSKRRI